MKKLALTVLASTTAALVIATSAMAADLPRRTLAPAPAPVLPIAPVFTWTGFYVGVHAGYASADISARSRAVSPGLAGLINAGVVPGAISVESEGFIGGAQVGYNLQFGAFVAGLEADISYVDGDTTSIYADALGGATRTTVDYKTSFFGTVRGRVGVAFDRILVYGTGGLAFSDVDATVTVTNPNTPGLRGFGRIDETAVGWTVGGGVEFALTNNITVKGEYLYYDFGQHNVSVTEPTFFPGQSATYQAEADGHIGRVGLNFKF